MNCVICKQPTEGTPGRNNPKTIWPLCPGCKATEDAAADAQMRTLSKALDVAFSPLTALRKLRQKAKATRARDDAEAREYQKDAKDAAALGPIVLLGPGGDFVFPIPKDAVVLARPIPKHPGKTVTRTVTVEIDVEVEIELDEDEDDDGCGSPRSSGNSLTGRRGSTTVAGRAWLAAPKAAMRAIEDAAYEAAMDIEDLEASDGE